MRLRQGEEAALAELYDHFAGRAFGLALRVLNDFHAAEDVVQDAFLWTWENADRIDETRGSPGALLLTVTHRRAVDALRRRKHRERKADASAIEVVDREALKMLAKVDDQDLIDRMKLGLRSLSEPQRQVVEMAYFGGMTQVAIAEEVATPVGTVKSRLRLALGHLRKSLGGASDAHM